ncbi:hypothetical protein M8494_35940 [Serratia ureilytica]
MRRHQRYDAEQVQRDLGLHRRRRTAVRHGLQLQNVRLPAGFRRYRRHHSRSGLRAGARSGDCAVYRLETPSVEGLSCWPTPERYGRRGCRRACSGCRCCWRSSPARATLPIGENRPC